MTPSFDCCGKASALMSLDETISRLLSKSYTCPEPILKPISEALNYVLAEDIASDVSVPPHDNSAVDGYAIQVDDLTSVQPQSTQTLPVSLRVPAGSVPAVLEKGTAARIFTGAPIPEGADCVVMQEDCEYDSSTNEVVINAPVRTRQNIRPAGQDVEAGEVILKTGSKLTPQCLGLIASIGIGEVKVYRKLKVGIFFTGDELVEPGEDCKPGQIYNSNRYQLKGLIETLGFDVIDLGIVPDQLEETKSSLIECSQKADVVITTGGASVGEEDYIRKAIIELGDVDFWRIAIKPGKPFMYGEINQTPVIGLPGNPGAVLVTFLVLARSFLLKLQGLDAHTVDPILLPSDFETTRSSNRREFVRAKVIDGHLQIHPNQSSGMLSSANWADGLAIIPENELVSKGKRLAYFPFYRLLSA